MDKALSEAMRNPAVALAKHGKLPDRLGLKSIIAIMFHHVIDTIDDTADEMVLRERNIMVFRAVGIMAWVIQSIKSGLLCPEGYTHSTMGAWLDDEPEPILSHDTFQNVLQMLRLWPLPNDCLLRVWWGATSRSNKHLDMDKIAEQWLKENPDSDRLLSFDEVKDELQRFYPGLFMKGYNGWWRSQNIIQLKVGRPKTT